MSSFYESTSDCLDRFEATWREAPYPNLRDWLKSKNDSEDIELAIELCAVDLEWRWRVNAATKKSRREVKHNDFPLSPVADDYRAILGDFWVGVEVRRRLAIVEWGVRNLWGDRPDTDAFQSMFPGDKDLQQRIETHLDSLLPLEVSVTEKGALAIQTYVPACFQIGRQRIEEPSSPAWVSSESRLLIAKSEERKISRHQLRVRRTRRGELEFANAIGAYSVRANSLVLEPGQVSRVTLPVELPFGNLLVSFREAFDTR